MKPFTTRVAIILDGRLWSKTVDFPQMPLIGDTIVVWSDEGEHGIHCPITARQWDTRFNDVALILQHDNVTAKELEEMGWK